MQAMSSALLEECEDLDARRITLANRLREAARMLEEQRIPASSHLTELLAAYVDKYGQVAARVGVDETASLQEIRLQLVSLARREQAIARLNDCLNVRSPREPELLAPCHDQVRVARSQLESRSEKCDELIAAIESGRHPALCLWKLVALPGALTDEEWQMALEAVHAEFGTALAVAAARGRLTIGECVAAATFDGLTPIPSLERNEELN